MKDHSKGTTLGLDGSDNEPEAPANIAQEKEVSEVELLGLDGEDIGAEEFELQEVVTAMASNDELTEYVVPREM